MINLKMKNCSNHYQENKKGKKVIINLMNKINQIKDKKYDNSKKKKSLK